MLMLGYRATSLLATVALLQLACGEVRQRVSSGPSHGGDEQPRLFHKESKDERVGPAAGARRHTSAVLPVNKGHFPQKQFHSSPDQHRRTQSSCPEGSPIEITSSLSSDLEGCYFQTEVDVGDDLVEIVYTPSGGPGIGQLWMHPDGVILDGVPRPGIYWWLAFVTAVDEVGAVTTSALICYSEEEATSHTPAEVTTWNCGLDVASAAEFSVACGGSCTDSSTPDEPEPSATTADETPAPTAAEAPEAAEAETSEPTEPLTPEGELGPTPEPVQEDSTPSPSLAAIWENTSGPTQSTLAPAASTRGVDTPQPTTSPDSADLVPGDTPAPFAGQLATSDGDRRASWSVFRAGVVSVAILVSRAGAWGK